MGAQAIDTTNQFALQAKLSQVFTPSAPINRADLFAGRQPQVGKVLDAIFQRGQHVVIYGERGVGKTSLAITLHDFLRLITQDSSLKYQIVRVNCAANSTFASVWHGVAKELSLASSVPSAGFTASTTHFQTPAADALPPNPGSEDIRYLLQRIGTKSIVVIDEFDRIQDPATAQLMADTIKSLSDHSVDATLIIVGVADSIDELVAEHKSVERALVQVQMPRMDETEMNQIIDKGLSKVGMSIDSEVKKEITNLSQGLPHYTHSLARYAAYAAIAEGRTDIQMQDLKTAIESAVDGAQQSIVSGYHRATKSAHSNLYQEVLLAAALAPNDILGYFTAGDVREPLSLVRRKPCQIDGFMRHLNEFCRSQRGPILLKKGERRSFRFRFEDPLMEPFIVMKGMKDGRLTNEDLEKLSAAKRSA